ncbi:MAG: NfeD family protein [Xanthomonadales bacterium]|nr:NfeD family protein [Xanthomonadales bacterium]
MPAIYWLILGLILIVLELFSPGAYLLWLGLAALATALLAWLAPELELLWQTIAFGLLAVAWILGYRHWRRRFPAIEASDRPLLNQRAARLVGQVHVLAEPLVDGRGRLQVGDTYWRLAGPDIAAGQRVRIVATEGMVLQVEPLA